MEGAPQDQTPVTQVDLAFFRLRRLWHTPKPRQIRAHRADLPPLHQSNILVIQAIAAAGEGGGEVTVGAVAEQLDIDPSTASRLVADAIEAGYVSRRASAVDARRAQLHLTDAGREVMASAADLRRSYIADLLTDWTDEERRQFARLLTRFAEKAASTQPDAREAEKFFQRVRECRRAHPNL